MTSWNLDEDWDYRGHRGRTHEDSEPWYPDPPRPDGPDIVMIVLDDIGFADLGCYGSEVNTNNLDRLAATGQRYNNFHTTSLCSPSRACLLTGRNHHSVGMRMISNIDSGWPSGRGRVTRRAALVSETLQDAGYNTIAVGKWHLAPMTHASPAGPFEEWPLGRGFNHFYGFLNGATDQFYPELKSDNDAIDPPTRPEDGYHLTDDLIDHATRHIADHVANNPANPYFLYLSLGTAHAPHQAPAPYLDAVRGCYDMGWDVIREERYKRQLETGVIPPGTALPPRNPDVPEWSSLSDGEQQLTARLQEAYAAFIEHADDALGRLFDFLKQIERWDNTLTIVVSDNGAAMEGGRLGSLSRIHFFSNLEIDLEEMLASLEEIGGPAADNHYAAGWAQASNTPLRWYKYHTHGGGIRDPLIISWPGHVAEPGIISSQFHHAIDLAPTIYEAAGIEPPRSHRGVAQLPMHGTSMLYTLTDPGAKTRRSRQYFEMFGNRGIWSHGWKAVTRHYTSTEYSPKEWELYNLDTDFSEANDLAFTEPDRLAQLVKLWWNEAGRYDVLPLDDRTLEHYQAGPPLGSPLRRNRFDFYPPISHIERPVCPRFEKGSHRIEAIVSGEKEGVVLAFGSTHSGFVIYVQGGTIVYEYNPAGKKTECRVELPDENRVEISLDFDLFDDRSGRARLSAGTDTSEWQEVEHVLPFLTLAGMDIGRDHLSPVSTRYVAPFPFTGQIERVSVVLDYQDANLTLPLDD